MSKLLGREAELVGPATFTGRLYRIAWYPGLVDGEPGDVVHGELHRLHDPQQVFVWLDEFEGVTRGASSVTDPDQYARTERAVRVGADNLHAWVYLYLGPLGEAARVSDGRWSPDAG
jgi:gamma-glutamylcyclotransferase (GGCT)/AIG2-like uncharacterized protein YtfP